MPARDTPGANGVQTAVTPAGVLADLLAHERRHGCAFDAAWPRAFARLHFNALTGGAVEGRDWRVALLWARPVYRRAYLRQPQLPGERAALRLTRG